MPQERPQTRHQTPGTRTEGYPCECCTPPNILHLRPDLGMSGAVPRWAICIVHSPKPSIHEWDAAAGKYVLRPDYSQDQRGEIVDGKNTVVSEREITPDRVFEMDEGPGTGGAAPRTARRVDLGQDQYYL